MSKTKKQWAIGPFNPVAISDDKKSNQRHKSLKWLDKQAPNSVVFVSFGTTTSLSDEQIKELAIGLEKSEQKFIWSITMGVPIAAWPMHSDQPTNAVLVTKVLKVGVVVKDWARQGELVTSLTVEEAVRRLMASKEGNEIRKRAAEFGGAVRQSVAEGGVSRMELDSFIAHIIR
ncbi:hypothetical protein F0562_017421 [Nyssa sinensis]|uniref:Uncharacterized protein n=1 Tax=Nyssa sinensis TaxID=561372 RepID=A0A5J4ZHW5_9ASTE|nr:hypothetical protein F0562_017421 [Nyssa sinensis]